MRVGVDPKEGCLTSRDVTVKPQTDINLGPGVRVPSAGVMNPRLRWVKLAVELSGVCCMEARLQVTLGPSGDEFRAGSHLSNFGGAVLSK